MSNNRSPMQIISGIMLFVLGAALLGYTASRTLSFIELTLPADRVMLGYLALAAFDGGLIVWALLYMWNAASHVQRGIALGMIGVSIVGVCIGFIADTLVQSGRNGIAGKVDTATVQAALWVTVIIIALNIIASFAYHLTSPAHHERVQEQELRATIESAARKQVSKNAEVLAEQLAPRMAADTVRRMQTKYLAGLGTTPALPMAGSARQVSSPARIKSGRAGQTRIAASPRATMAQSERDASGFELVEKPVASRFKRADPPAPAPAPASAYIEPVTYYEPEEGQGPEPDFLELEQEIPVKHNGREVQ